MGALCLSAGSRRPCSKCSGVTAWLQDGTECVCSEFFCAACYKDLGSCSCQSPLIFRGFCQDCGHKVFLHEPVSGEDGCVCPECHQGLLECALNDVGTLDICGICNTFRDQDDIVPCDGDPCQSAAEDDQFMGHTTCFHKVEYKGYADGAFLCQACFQSGTQPYCCSSG